MACWKIQEPNRGLVRWDRTWLGRVSSKSRRRSGILPLCLELEHRPVPNLAEVAFSLILPATLPGAFYVGYGGNEP